MKKRLFSVMVALLCVLFVSIFTSASALEKGEAIIWKDGNKESLTIKELLDIHATNAIRWQNSYTSSRIMAIDSIKKIELDKFVVLENNSYTPKVTIYTDNGLVLSIRSDNATLQNVSVGETIQLTGKITGFLKYDKGIGIINTNGDGTDIQIFDDSRSEEDNLFLMICDYATNNKYRDVSDWAEFYSIEYPESKEAIDALEELTHKIKENCYPGTFIKKYDIAVGCSSVKELSVADHGEGYDYVDSNLSSNIQVYGRYLMDQGYVDKGLAKCKVNGEEDAYELFSNSDGVNFGLAQAPGSVMRVVIYAPEAVAQRIFNEVNKESKETNTQKVYNDKETIKKVQVALNNAGYKCGTPDGIAGKGTYSALNAFQRENGLKVENCITVEVLAALGID